MHFFRSTILRLLTWYFDFLPIPSSFTRLLKGQTLPVIITQSSSVIVQALVASFARRSGCSLEPTSALTRTGVKSDVLYFTSLNDTDGVQALLDTGEIESGKIASFSTLNIFRGKGPVWSHPSYTMKWMDFAALLLGPPLRCKFLLIIFGDPIPFLNREGKPLQATSVHKLTRQFKLDYYSNLKIVRGTPFQKFSTQERIVLGGHDYERTLTKLAKSLDVPEKKLHEQAKKAFRVIAARPRAWFFIPTAVILRFVLQRLFTDIQVRGLPGLAQAIKKDTVVLVPMHRSHLDYLIIGQVLYDANLNTPIIAAGINLSFWPAGWIIRTLGGYFVKRNAQGDRLHALVLRRYVSYLIKRGHLQEFFIEGGRSRNGRMRPPKLGLLKTMVNAYLKKVRKDVVFVPVSISYEHVIEDTEYAKENTGSKKTEENLISLFRARGMLRQKYKEVIIHFGKGVRFSKYREDFLEQKSGEKLIEQLALDLSRRIEGQTSIGLRSLTYLALFLSPNYGLVRSQLEEQVERLVEAAEWYRALEENDTYALPTPALQKFLETDEEEVSHEFYSGGVTVKTSYLGNELFFIPGKVRYTADFYKNSVAHVYFYLGVLSALHALNKPLTAKEAKVFYELLRYELLLPAWHEFKLKFEKYREILVTEGVLEKRGEDYRVSETGLQYLIPGLILPQVECLLWIYLLLNTEQSIERPHPHDPSTSRRVYDYNLFLRSAQQQLRYSKYQGRFNRTEISSLSIITSALDSLAARGILTFQERYGKRVTFTLEEMPKGEIRFLEEAHCALIQATQMAAEVGDEVSSLVQVERDDSELVQ